MHESDDKREIEFESEEGIFTFRKGATYPTYWSEDSDLRFDDYRLVGRRTIDRHLRSENPDIGIADVENKHGVNTRAGTRPTSHSYRGQEESPEYDIPNDEGSNRLIWDDCTPTRDRRPTTAEDVEEDIHVEDYNTAEELFETLLELSSYEEEDFEDYDTTSGKIEAILTSFDDPGDGSPNILYCLVNGEELDGSYPYDCLSDLDLASCTEEDVIDAVKSEFVEE